MGNVKCNIKLIEDFLKRVDDSFPVKISEKQDLHQFSVKLIEKATLCLENDGNNIISLVAGYTENLINNIAYISLVATVSGAQGKGLASKLVKEFIEVCRNKNIDAIHLYAVATNDAAINMYKKIGFVEWTIWDEPRPDDVHLIYYLR